MNICSRVATLIAAIFWISGCAISPGGIETPAETPDRLSGDFSNLVAEVSSAMHSIDSALAQTAGEQDQPLTPSKVELSTQVQHVTGEDGRLLAIAATDSDATRSAQDQLSMNLRPGSSKRPDEPAASQP